MAKFTSLLLLLMFLTACGGEDENQSGDAKDSGTTEDWEQNPPSDNTSSVLSRFFVESFDLFEATARNLIENDARYLLQKQTWYSDANGNGQFDSEAETLYRTYPLLSSGVHYAHAAGLTGAGQVIAITDDGFLPEHEAFAGKLIDLAGNLTVEDHGTQVASVAAGNSASMIGVAPGADLAFGSFATFQTRAAAARAAERLSAVALNNSWGFANTPVSQSNFDRVFASSAAQDYLAALHSYAERGVVIFAAGNTRTETEAELMPALPVVVPELERSWLAVINAVAELDGENIVAATRLSAGCLEAAAWCLAAEGSWMGATSEDSTSYSFASGTSFAAPMVAGAMALLGEAFPDLSPHELRIRVLASASNTFAGFEVHDEVELVPGFSHAISNEWGHGFLDIKAALLPIGQTTTTMIDGSVYDVARPLVVEGAATGDAVTRALKGVKLAAYDALDTRFAIPAGSLVAQRVPRPLLNDIMRNGGARQDCCGLTSYFSGTYLVTMGQASTVANLMLPREGAGQKNYGASIGQAFENALGSFSVTLGVGRDSGYLLPQWGGSAAGTAILAGELALSTPLAAGIELKLGVGLGGALGGTARGTLLNSASAGVSAADFLQRGDRLTLTLGLPVAVAQGRTSVTLPIETRSGTIVQQATEIDLAPIDREMRLGLGYSFPVSKRSEIALSAAYSRNHGNVAGRHDAAALASFNLRF